MSDGSSIEWTDATWQPVVGCTRISRGCDGCYAISSVHRFRKADGLTKLRPRDAARPGLDWSGKVALQSERLADPMHWKKPRRIFVCSQADLFHDAVPFEYIAAVFGVMATSPRHTFQVLTKRPARMLEFFAWVREQPKKYADETGAAIVVRVLETKHYLSDGGPDVWPLPNVHLGVSVEDQATADERIPLLLQCPARVHWCSYEPALGPVDFRLDEIVSATTGRGQALQSRGDVISWIVVGGESGARARPFDIAWARSVIEQCAAIGVRTVAFVKQLGSHPHSGTHEHGRSLCTDSRYIWTFDDRDGETYDMHDRKGKTMADWPTDLRVREMPT